MADTVKEAVTNATGAFLAWPLHKRVTMVASIGLGLAVLVTMLAYTQRQSLVPLMTNLSEEDAAQIIAALENDHVHYELGGAGTAVLVPEGEVYRLRLKLAGEGLPRGGNVGFELFDSPSFGMSRFAEQLNFRRGLEGELRRTIKQIDSVKDARVHIVVPEQSLFREEEQHASASVTLHLQPGRVLSPPQVQAIVHLVSSAVSGLNTDRVTVVDSTGHILAKGGEGGVSGGMSGMLEQQRNIERSIEERVHAMLSPIVGADHVVVRASAAIDLSRTDKTTETFDPASQAMRSRQESEERRTGPAAANPQGIPGARSNLTGVDPNSASQVLPGNSERRSSTSNYEINKVVAHEMGASGRLSRLSVAVLVDGVENTAADGSKAFQERPATELARYEELARRAMGFDADREDQVTVQSIPFGGQTPAAVDTAEVAGTPPWVGMAERFWPPLVALIAVGILGAVAWRARPMAGAQAGAGNNEANAAAGALGGYAQGQFQGGRTVRELEAAIGRASADGQSAFNLGSPPPDVMAKLTTRLEPKLAASVLKGWLNEPS